jgi:ribosome maturation factor RimP
VNELLDSQTHYVQEVKLVKDFGFASIEIAIEGTDLSYDFFLNLSPKVQDKIDNLIDDDILITVCSSGAERKIELWELKYLVNVPLQVTTLSLETYKGKLIEFDEESLKIETKVKKEIIIKEIKLKEIKEIAKTII